MVGKHVQLVSKQNHLLFQKLHCVQAEAGFIFLHKLIKVLSCHSCSKIIIKLRSPPCNSFLLLICLATGV